MRTTVSILLVLGIVLVATAAAPAAPRRVPASVLAPDLGVDPCHFTTTYEVDMGLSPGHHRTWYLPTPRLRGPATLRGRRLVVRRVRGPWGYSLNPWTTGHRVRRLVLPWRSGIHGEWMYNRAERLLRVSREHEEAIDPDWEAGLARLRNLKAVADVELRAGRPVHAAVAAWRQVERDPDDAMAHLLLSDALLLLENHDFAGEAAREGLRLAPGLLRAGIDKRGFLDDPAPLEAAIARLAATLERVPGSGFQRFLLGYELLFTGRPAEAVEHLEAAAEAWPWDPVPRMALRVARERAGS
jgi:hypothetical protein